MNKLTKPVRLSVETKSWLLQVKAQCAKQGIILRSYNDVIRFLIERYWDV